MKEKREKRKAYQRSSEISVQDAFEHIQEITYPKEADEHTGQEIVGEWTSMDVRDLRVMRKNLTIMVGGAWLTCLGAAVIRFALTGEYLAMVIVLALIAGPVVAYHFYSRKKIQKLKKKGRKDEDKI